MVLLRNLFTQLKETISAIKSPSSNTEEVTKTEQITKRLSLTVSGFYENEKVAAIKEYLGLSKAQAVFQKGYSEKLGYIVTKRWSNQAESVEGFGHHKGPSQRNQAEVHFRQETRSAERKHENHGLGIG